MSPSFLYNLISSLSSSNSYFFPWQVVQASFWAEEMANFYHRKMKEEEGRCNTIVEVFSMAEKSN